MSSTYQRPAFTVDPENQLSAVEMKSDGLASDPGLGMTADTSTRVYTGMSSETELYVEATILISVPFEIQMPSFFSQMPTMP